ncbi:hypothetical protein [Mycobacteroides franklinii]|uniref:Uncharacterized protein n=1 Tax=Mycobacteroides franklinii TaxID=948102 RepID=A0A4R5PEI9_9MYCO|nr:hypothetical protein [Mycobacteroides franklinii]ORA64146.1 hypothetical protein BST24_03020 [Mycobacteroides franklinii]TDH23867.1 hypothetical protein EJ571_06395 [Mycobacteroides franklinii]
MSMEHNRFRFRAMPAVTALFMLLISCGVPQERSLLSTEPAAPASDDVFAYTTAAEIGIVRNGVVVNTASTPSTPGQPVFTSSGNYVAAAIPNRQIVAVGIAGSTRVIEAATDRVFSGGGDKVSWWQAPNRIVSTDLSIPSAPLTVDEVDPLIDPSRAPQLISYHNGIAVFAQSAVAPQQPHPGFGAVPAPKEVMVTRDGHTQSAGVVDGALFAGAISSSNGRQVAYPVFRAGACSTGTVGVVTTGTATSTVLPPVGDPDTMTTIKNLWWDTDDMLRVTTYSRACKHPDAVGKLSIWQFGNENWTRVDSADSLVSRQLPNNSTALVTSMPDAQYGELSIEHAGERHQIKDNVTDLAAPTGSAV